MGPDGEGQRDAAHFPPARRLTERSSALARSLLARLDTEGNLDGYQKKKYLSKIVFTYILGYKVDVGHMEAVNLISSSKYSEKQIVSTVFPPYFPFSIYGRVVLFRPHTPRSATDSQS